MYIESFISGGDSLYKYFCKRDFYNLILSVDCTSSFHKVFVIGNIFSNNFKKGALGAELSKIRSSSKLWVVTDASQSNISANQKLNFFNQLNDFWNNGVTWEKIYMIGGRLGGN